MGFVLIGRDFNAVGMICDSVHGAPCTYNCELWMNDDFKTWTVLLSGMVHGTMGINDINTIECNDIRRTNTARRAPTNFNHFT